MVREYERRPTLDEEVSLSRAVADPKRLAGGAPDLLVIDEVQRAPDLMRAVKLSVGRDRQPGRSAEMELVVSEN